MLPRLTEDVTLGADKALYCTLKFKMLKINLFYLIEFCSQIYVSIILYYLLFVKSFSFVCLKEVWTRISKMYGNIPGYMTTFKVFRTYLYVTTITGSKPLLSDTWHKILFV